MKVGELDIQSSHGGQRRVVHITYRHPLLAEGWLFGRAKLERDDGREIIQFGYKRSSRGERYEARIVSVTPAWLVARNQERLNRRLDEKMAREAKEKRRELYGCRHSWHTQLPEHKSDFCPGCKKES